MFTQSNANCWPTFCTMVQYSGGGPGHGGVLTGAVTGLETISYAYGYWDLVWSVS